MKVRIKREQLKKWEVIASSVEFGKAQRFFFLPEEIELEISESDIVKEKSNRDKWEEVFIKICDWQVDFCASALASFFDQYQVEAAQAYEKIVEGK